MALKDKTVSSLLWSFSGTGVSQLLTVLLTFYLARLLGPEVFGKFAVVTLVAVYANRAIDAGLGVAIIQRKDLDYGLVTSIFWLNTGLALLLAILVYVLADTIAGFMEIPDAAPLLRWLPLVLLVNGITFTHRALLNRSMNFKIIGIAEICSVVIGGTVAIIAALYFGDERALFARLGVVTLVVSIIYWLSTNWRPSFSFRTAGLRETLAFSLPFLGEKTLMYWAIRLDRVLIAKRLNENALGLFDTGAKQMAMPVELIRNQVGRVLFATFSNIQDDVKRIEDIYSKLISVGTLFGMPLMALIVFASPEVVLWVLGAEWTGLIIVLQGLALAYVLEFGTFLAPVLLSRGKSSLQLKVKVYALVFRITLIILGLYWGGLEGLLLGLVVASVIRYLIYSSFIARELEVRQSRHLRLLLPAVVISGLSLAGAYFVFQLVAGNWPLLVLLLLKFLLFFGLFGVLLLSFRPRGWMLGRKLLLEYHYKFGPLGPIIKRFLS